MKKITQIVFLLMLLICSSFTVAQQAGAATFGATDSFSNDSIDLFSLTPTVSVPVLAKRGAIPFNFELNATSYCAGITVGTNNNLDCSSGLYSPGMSLLGAGSGYGMTNTVGSCTTFSQFYVMDSTGSNGVIGRIQPTSSGAHHPIPLADTLNSCMTNQTFTDITTDASGLTLKATIVTGGGINLQVWDASGNYTETAYLAGGTDPAGLLFTSVSDTFGNKISSSGSVFTDSLNVAAITKLSNGYQWTDTNGAHQQVTISNGTPLTIQSGFCLAILYDGSGLSMSPYTVDYPDGTSVAVNLEQGTGGVSTTTGRIGSFTMRTGATITYGYGTMTCHGSGPATLSSLTRTTPDGTTTYTLTGGTNSTTIDTVLDPGKNKKVYTFTGFASGVFLTQVQIYQNTNTVASPVYTLLTTDLYCYNGATSGCAAPATGPTYPITQRDVYHTINGMSSSRTHESFDSYGNRTSVARYDFGAGSPTTTTTTTYGTWNGTNCVGVGSSVFDKPCDVVTSDGTHTLAESHYSYSSKGFKTTDSQWSGTVWVSSTFTPNTKGTTATSTSPSGLVTTYTYGDCNSLLLTGTSAVVNGTTLTTGATWDCNGAVVMSTTDANSNGTSSTYELMFRPLSLTDESGQTTLFSYTSNSVTKTLSFGAISTSTTETVDSLGRVIRSQTTDGSNYDTTSTTHGFSGGPNWREGSAVPCLVALGSDCTITTYKYTDPIGRTINTVDGNGGTFTWTYLGSGTKYDTNVTVGPASTGENVKQMQKETDGLGRIKSTCALEVSGGTACGYAMSGSGILTSNTYSFGAGTSTVVSTRGAQSRTIIKDALGRATSVTTPEAGTTTYDYDVVICPNSPSSPGNLTCSVDAFGTNTIYFFDVLNRLTDVNAIGNGNCRRYRFDKTSNGLVTPPSGTFSNLMGRLVEAATDNCTLPITPITDEWFSYDANGRLTDVWESTPHSGGYYHTTAAYWLNGALETLSGIPGYSSYSVALNSNGLPYSSMLGSTVLVNKVFRNAAGQPTTIGFGTGADQDTYTYDSNTGQMKTYTFTVGSASDTGTLTWNKNRTLQKLVISDGFNAGGSQTCNFTYDDVARLLTDNCGSTLWNQTYTYDQHNNLTKAGNPGTSWSPGYSPTTNRINGASYDADGNVTYDLNNTYTWDGYHKMMSARSGTSQAVCGTSGTCVTYDALGRAVENNAVGTYNQYMYSPAGMIAVMSGQTRVKGRLPLPGWGTGGSNYINHLDWLGSTRVQSDMGSVVYFDTAYTPYSENYDTFGPVQSNFTGYNQDLFAGLFDTPNRELDQTSGSRWLSPDPSGSGWNLYAYGTNPNSETDPTGLFPVVTSSGRGPSNTSEFQDLQYLWVGGAGGVSNPYGLDLGRFGRALERFQAHFRYSGDNGKTCSAERTPDEAEMQDTPITLDIAEPPGASFEELYASAGAKSAMAYFDRLLANGANLTDAELDVVFDAKEATEKAIKLDAQNGVVPMSSGSLSHDVANLTQAATGQAVEIHNVSKAMQWINRAAAIISKWQY